MVLLSFTTQAASPEATILLENWKDAIYTPFETSKFQMTIRRKGESPIIRRADVFYTSKNRSDVKVFMRFNFPISIRGTAFLSLKKTQSNSSDQWIYFPAYKKARRLSSRKKNDRFLDSDFSNGDISFEYHSGYKFKVIKDSVLEKQEVYVIEGTSPLTEKTLYAKQVLYISKKNNLNLKTEFYDRKNQLTKELTVKKWKRYGNHWAIDNATMKDLKNQSETEIEFLSRNTSKRPQNKMFTLINLERGK